VGPIERAIDLRTGRKGALDDHRTSGGIEDTKGGVGHFGGPGSEGEAASAGNIPHPVVSGKDSAAVSVRQCRTPKRSPCSRLTIQGGSVETQRTAPKKSGSGSLSEDAEAPGPVVSEIPSVQDLATLRSTLEHQHESTLARVGTLVENQKTLTTAIAGEISAIRADGDALQQLESAEQSDAGLLVSITRRLGRRSRMLERRTVASRLQDQYADVHTTLRKASAFADELRLCAVELAGGVDQLHADVESSLSAVVEFEGRITAIDTLLAELGAEEGLAQQRRIDKLHFERADLQTGVNLLEAKARLCAREVEPARKLRETVQSMHQEMARYVLHASSSVEGSGRRIQALGLAADAPVVVSELQEGLDQLDLAMAATEAYLDQAHEMLTRILPELSAQIRQQGNETALELEAGLSAIGRAREGAASDADLKAAALAEVELLGLDIQSPSKP